MIVTVDLIKNCLFHNMLDNECVDMLSLFDGRLNKILTGNLKGTYTKLLLGVKRTYTVYVPLTTNCEWYLMMTSSNGNMFRVAGRLCGEFTGHQWRGDLMFPLICAWINGWAINREAIQIKICEKCLDMLPRPRLVCQEPGLRPIGPSPGVSDKSSRGLNLFYSIYSPFYTSVGLVGNLAGLPCRVPCWGAADPWNTLCHLCHRTGEIDG